VTSTAVPALAELELLVEALRIATPWLAANLAGDGVAAEAVGNRIAAELVARGV
jgi:hypothetical protein